MARIKLNIETFSNKSAEWLELSICKRGPCVATRPRFKETSLAIPLAPSSAHPRHVHKAWPRARLLALRSLCSHEEFYDAACNEFRQRLSQSFLSDYVDRIMSTVGNLSTNRADRGTRPDARPMWLKLRFNPELGSTVPRALKRFLEHPGFRQIAMQAMRCA